MKTEKPIAEAEAPVWGLAALGRIIGVSEFALLRWIKAGDPRVRCFRKTKSNRWYGYPSEIREAMRK